MTAARDYPALLAHQAAAVQHMRDNPWPTPSFAPLYGNQPPKVPMIPPIPEVAADLTSRALHAAPGSALSLLAEDWLGIAAYIGRLRALAVDAEPCGIGMSDKSWEPSP